MKLDARHRCATRGCRAWLLPALAAAGLVGFSLTAAAQSRAPSAGVQRVAAPLDLPQRPAQAQGDLVVMVCRRALEEPRQPAQPRRDAPMLCMATEADEDTVQMGPARFRDLLERAVQSGATVVFVLQPQ